MTSSSDTLRAAVRNGGIWRGSAVATATRAPLHAELPVLSDRRGQAVAMDEQIEAARTSGYAEGFESGFEAGRAAALESAAVARDEALQRGAAALTAMAGALAEGRADAVRLLERDAADLAVELTRVLVGHELAHDGAAVAATVRRALDLCPPDEDLVVRLHPDEVVDEAQLAPLVSNARVRVVADADVERGGCVIDAGPCRIDAQITPALERVRSALCAMQEEGPAQGFSPAEA